jgi:hypothetical protein
MRVKCVVSKSGWLFEGVRIRRFFWEKWKDKPANGPKKGDVVTVENKYWSNGELYYKLVEWPNGYGYISKAFEPLDDDKEEKKEEFKKVSFTEIEKEVPAVSEN